MTGRPRASEQSLVPTPRPDRTGQANGLMRDPFAFADVRTGQKDCQVTNGKSLNRR